MPPRDRQSAHDSWRSEPPAFDDEPTEVRQRLQELWGPFSEACEPLVRKTVREEEKKLTWWQTALIGLGVTLIAGGVSALVGMVVVSSQADGVQDGKIEVNAEDIADLGDDVDHASERVDRLDREVGELGTKVDGMKTSVDSLAKEIREDRAARYPYSPPMTGNPPQGGP